MKKLMLRDEPYQRIDALSQSMVGMPFVPDPKPGDARPPGNVWTPSRMRAAFEPILQDAERDGYDVSEVRACIERAIGTQLHRFNGCPACGR